MKDDVATVPELVTRSDARRPGESRGTTGDLPVTLLRQAARRLEIICLLMILITLVSWVGVNLIEGQLDDDLRNPEDWVPPVTGLAVSTALYLLARSRRLSPLAIINFGLAYEVGVSYFMAYGQYWNTFSRISPERLNGDLVGISSVALWMAFFTVIVPSRPRNALVALVLSGSAVPLTMLHFMRTGNAPVLPPMEFFFIFVLPYLITVFMCMVAANIIYDLGRDVRRAQRMGSYELLDLIGRGGMGEVWRARHNLLARPAAIKLIRPDSFGPDPARWEETIARFEQEAQTTANLESPHTVELYDFGMSEDGSLYYVMELLSGIDLDTLVRRFGPVPPERAVHILRQVCTSLAEAHRRGLIHRDIKPANILLCEHAFERDFVKVLDFGLVKRLAEVDEEAGPGVFLTRKQVVPGTPAFLAPEIATGKGTVDGRADLYSLGCVGFWLVTGRPVFEGETPMAVILHQVNTPPPRPGESTELPMPEELEAAILDCLAKDPDLRPAGAGELARSLEAIPFETPWTRARAEEWWNTHRPVESGTDSRVGRPGRGSGN